NEKRAAGFIKKTGSLKRNLSQRERLYVNSMIDLVASTGDKRKRQERHLETLKKIMADYPKDLEAKAFYVVRAWQFKTAVQTAALDKMLDDVFAVNPLHPAHHYRIHLWDGPNASKALSAAALCVASAPACAHMWHMPGHTYDKLKRHAEAAWNRKRRRGP